MSSAMSTTTKAASSRSVIAICSSSKTTTIEYNNHGDKERERQTFKNNSVFPRGASWTFDDEGKQWSRILNQRTLNETICPQTLTYAIPTNTTASTNWTERVVTREDGSKSTARRTITYY